jgi:DNA-binding transcriptional LysR family regulator
MGGQGRGVTLAQLRYLVAIIDCGMNITLAAERVHATQPGLSKQLKLLEEELGFQIFVRKGKSLERLSPAGAQVVESARLILGEAGNIRSLAANHRGEARGELRILTTQTQAQFALPPALRGLREGFPDVTVHLSFTRERPDKSLLADEDLAIVSSDGPPAGPEAAVPLYRWNWVALVPVGHALTRLGRALTLADLSAHPLVGYESSRDPQSSLSRTFAEAELPAQFAYTAQDSEVIKTYVRSGLGVGVVAEMALGEARSDLVALDIADLLPTCTTWAILPRDRVLRDYVVAFLTSLAPHLKPRDLHRCVQSGDIASPASAPPWRRPALIQSAPDRSAVTHLPTPIAFPTPSRRLAMGC